MTNTEIVEEYFRRGYRVVFWAANGADKGPKVNGWQNKVTTIDDYKPGYRVGLITGVEVAPGKFLHDIDIDWGPGATVAGKLLPATRFVYGRAGKKLSHCFYLTDAPIVGMKYDDPADGTTLIELRGTKKDGTIGWQSMAPPSDWKNKNDLTAPAEALTFLKGRDGVMFDHPAEVSADALQKTVVRTVIAMTCAKHLGKNGFGHDVRLAWAGFLLKLGLTVDDVVAMGEAMSVYCNNLEVGDVRVVVEGTFRRIANKEPVANESAFAKFLGEHGRKIVTKIRQWASGTKLAEDKKGTTLRDDPDNIQRVLDLLGVTVRYDAFARRANIVRDGRILPLEDRHVIALWFEIQEVFHFRPSREIFDTLLQHLAWQNEFHPVREYLNSLQWDGVPRIDTWLVDCGGAPDTPYTRAVGRLVLIAAVRRARQPGAKFDEMTILESGQGTLKSSALRALCPEDAWFSDDLPLNVDAKEIIERTAGKWLIEASELDGYSKSRIEHLKANLSRQVDGPVRMAYGRLSVEEPRQFVIVGTTNTLTNYLKDSTGARRFWPVRIEKFNVDRIREHRDQLWAEAAHREAQPGTSIRLDPELWAAAGVEQDKRRAMDAWEEILDEADLLQAPFVAVSAIWDALGVEASRRDNRHAERIAAILQRHGYTEKRKCVPAGKLPRAFYWFRTSPPEQLALDGGTR